VHKNFKHRHCTSVAVDVTRFNSDTTPVWDWVEVLTSRRRTGRLSAPPPPGCSVAESTRKLRSCDLRLRGGAEGLGVRVIVRL